MSLDKTFGLFHTGRKMATNPENGTRVEFQKCVSILWVFVMQKEMENEREGEREIKTNPTQRAEQEICEIVDETIFRGTRKTSKREHYHRVFS